MLGSLKKQTCMQLGKKNVRDKRSLVKISLHGFPSVQLTDVGLELLYRRILIHSSVLGSKQ